MSGVRRRVKNARRVAAKCLHSLVSPLNQPFTPPFSASPPLTARSRDDHVESRSDGEEGSRVRPLFHCMVIRARLKRRRNQCTTEAGVTADRRGLDWIPYWRSSPSPPSAGRAPADFALGQRPEQITRIALQDWMRSPPLSTTTWSRQPQAPDLANRGAQYRVAVRATRTRKVGGDWPRGKLELKSVPVVMVTVAWPQLAPREGWSTSIEFETEPEDLVCAGLAGMDGNPPRAGRSRGFIVRERGLSGLGSC